MAESQIHGWTAEGWEGVRGAFSANFDQRKEVGAAFSAYHRGKKVVDLWGGIADERSGSPWEENTMVMVFSTTKGATAMCANQLAQQGKLDMDAPVAEYWPEFAQAGKEKIPVSYLLSHQAGLAWIDEKLTVEEALSWDPVVTALARQAPGWEPGTKHGYHASTYGWLVGEVVRRISGLSLGTYLAHNIAEPLGLDLYIGLPDSEEPRVATLVSFMPEGGSGDGDNELSELLGAFMGPETPLGKALRSPFSGSIGLEGHSSGDAASFMNSRELHAAEAPAFNGICDARSLARMYSAAINEVDGFRLLTPGQLKAATTQLTSGGNFVLFDIDLQFGLGFMLHSSLVDLGGPRSFGHFGMGGSLGWADPDAELAMGYVMNRMDMGMVGDVRGFELVTASFDAAAQAS